MFRKAKSPVWVCVPAVVCLIAGVKLASPQAGTSKTDFVRDVQPVLARSCFGCHGEKAQMGGLRLDARAAALKGGQTGKVIVPGNATSSLLYQRVAGTSDQARMPMGAKPLAAAEIAVIKTWIEQGAEWPEGVGAKASEAKKHWAFVPPVKAALPAVKNAAWAKNAIDRFVLAKLEAEGLQPSMEADRTTLLRRLSLDLTGLPPTPAEVDVFVKDKSRNAYEKQVERLLASPHYGERWGRHWLDAARYADSDGFEKDKPRNVWFYRDWVINALNRDLGYDKFITEQLAGDLLPNPAQDQLVATGFLRNSMINEEGGIDPEQFRMEAMFDRMDAIGRSVLGLTVQCSQCHNHKYDPFLQEDYYKIFAYLNNSHEANAAVYTPQEQQKRAELFRRMHEIEADLQHRTPDWRKRMSEWEARVKNDQPEWVVLRPEVDDISTGGQKYSLQPDGSFLAAGYAPTKHTVKMTAKTDLQNITAFRIELMNDPNLPLSGPGRSVLGTAALSEFMVEAAPVSDPKMITKVKFVKATADLNLPERELDPMYADKSKKRRVTGPVSYAIDGMDETAWSNDADPGRRNLPRKAVFVADRPIANAGGSILTILLRQNHGGWNSDDNQNHNLGRFRLSMTTATDAVADPVPAGVREILGVAEAQRTPAQTRTVFAYWRTTVPEWKQANAEIEALWQQYPAGSSQLVLSERGSMRSTHVLARGDFLKPGREIAPGVPAFLNPLPSGAPGNRLGLARWLTDRNAPTTARAMVNRVWQTYFGTGIVATSEDLGRQSEPPSHPELLDWLSVELMDRGWSMKSLHRMIVTSATYRQSSKVTPDLQEKDPFNRLLARGPRFRVEAEIVRDIALAASGLLNAKVGGPSVNPPAPEFLFLPPASYGPKQWPESKGAERYRRALYTFRYRSVPYPMLQTFDAPNGDFACVRRARSNTPLQALTTLNEPLFIETARALAKKTLAEGGKDDAQRIQYAFRRCLSRPPSAAERDELQTLLARARARYQSGGLKPEEMNGGEADARLAGWTAVARVLLNLDETITKE
ncbi:MAG: PSD1 domain-containing protein [Acidobacteria bacterium]|nr:PSD1 domain-containing protein [Acidobacteriota bacterium]